jgi:hypothetical protein
MKRAVQAEGALDEASIWPKNNRPFDLDTMWESSSTYSSLRCAAQPDSTLI